MNSRITQHLKDLNRLNGQRKTWLFLSGFVIVAISILVIDWSGIQHSGVFWTLGAFGLIVSVSWWYWTMRLIRYLINYRIEESVILHEIVDEIRSVKADIQQTIPRPVDKSK
jgi:Na+/melibiose symporter-like transporter